MRFPIILVLLTLVAPPAAAAPIWIERAVIPAPVLADPVYAQFDEGSVTRLDHAAWEEFLKSHVVAGEDGVSRVRYAAVSLENRNALRDYLRSFEGVDLSSLSRSEQAALWINIYNAATVNLILDHPATKSIRDIDDPWRRPLVTVGGKRLSLGEIEHNIVRPVFNDPRMHYALNCASIGCPNLLARAYRSRSLDKELDFAARAYVNHSRGVEVSGARITLSKIYGWYRDDFGPDEGAVLDHIRKYADPPLAAALMTATKISGYRYDWSLNAAP